MSGDTQEGVKISVDKRFYKSKMWKAKKSFKTQVVQEGECLWEVSEVWEAK